MRQAFFIAAFLSAASAPALAASEQLSCTRSGETQIIEVLTPGKVGKACDLNVIREGGAYRSTPYYADNSAAFCASRAKEIAASLSREGFSCAPAAGQTEAAAPQAASPPAVVASAEPAAPTASAAPERDAMEQLIAKATAPANAGATTATPPAAQPSAPVVAEAPPAVVGVPAAAAEAPTAQDATKVTALSEALNAPGPGATHVIEQPPPSAVVDGAVSAPASPESEPQQYANGGPVALSPTNASLKGVRAPRPAAGRFVGAAADAKPLDAATDPNAAEERLGAAPTPAAAPVPTAPAAATAAASAAVAPPSAAPAPRARAAEDIIRSVLAAQTAAWNDGDLDAFMNGYWQDGDMKFVSGSTISRGWKDAMKRYRELYGDGATMGKMSLDAVEIDLVTDDVATVVGRYRVVRAEATDVGLFTLVMKRFDGLWRIVHDHSTSEAPRTN